MPKVDKLCYAIETVTERTTPADPFFLPERDPFGAPRTYLVHTSGGATSGLMLRRILDAHGGKLPDYARALFANTGKERIETLRFLRAMAHRWRVDIHWIEYRWHPERAGGRKDPKHDVARVTFRTAARNGEPFSRMIQAKGYLPNPIQRICTSQLKIETAARYSRRILGWRKPWSILGMRADEPQRIRTAINESCRSLYPLYDAGITRADVDSWWELQPFRLGLRPDEGNCDLCMLKGRAKLRRLIREDPSRADWWIAQETHRRKIDRGTRQREIMQFNKRWSYSDLVAEALGKLPIPPPEPGDDESLPCHCTE